MTKVALVLYVPALHRGYIQLFKKYPAATLYLVDNDIIEQFPLTAREIRSIKPAEMKHIIEGTKYFPKVVLATKQLLNEMVKDRRLKIILSNDSIGDWLAANTFRDKKISRDSIFLRYDEKTVASARKEIEYTGQISKARLAKKIMLEAEQEAAKSIDWFLRVGGVLILKSGQKIIAHNERRPTEQDAWLVGDPRNFLVYGTDTKMRTAIHAEELLITGAAKRGWSTESASIYVTTFPCPDCSNIICAAGIKTVYFKEGFSELSSLDVFKLYGIEIIKVI